MKMDPLAPLALAPEHHTYSGLQVPPGVGQELSIGSSAL